MLPTPQAIAEASGLTEEEATAFFADLDTDNVAAVDFGSMLPDSDAFDGDRCVRRDRAGEEWSGRAAVPRPTSAAVAEAEEPAEGQCEAMTGSGSRCRNKAVEGSRYCRAHEKNAESDGMCKGHYADGRPCKSKAREGSGYCGVHGKSAE